MLLFFFFYIEDTIFDVEILKKKKTNWKSLVAKFIYYWLKYALTFFFSLHENTLCALVNKTLMSWQNWKKQTLNESK